MRIVDRGFTVFVNVKDKFFVIIGINYFLYSKFLCAKGCTIWSMGSRLRRETGAIWRPSFVSVISLSRAYLRSTSGVLTLHSTRRASRCVLRREDNALGRITVYS